jgi:Ca-activated chloride channel homolog
MTRATAWVAACTVGLAAGPLAAPQVFRSGVDTVLLSVTVTDPRNRPLVNLDRGDFQVFEDGVPQEIAVFAREPQPIALSLLLDSSTSMDEKIEVAREAAIGFANRLGPSDVAQVIDFNKDTQIRQVFTRDTRALERAIRDIRTGGSTALYTALYIAISELTRVRNESPDEIRRQAIVVLSDGEDTTSIKSLDDVSEAAKRSDVIIYAIGLRDKESGRSRGFSQADFALRTLTHTTGGRVFFVDDIRQLADRYREIADELANQYYIGYNSRNADRNGAWRQVAVRVDRSETVVRTRAGYFAPTRKP